MLTRPDDDEDDQIEGSIADDEGKSFNFDFSFMIRRPLHDTTTQIL